MSSRRSPSTNPTLDCHLSSIDAESAQTDYVPVSRGRTSILSYFGQSVRRHRLALDLSQEALAERADLHRTYVADIERGVRNVSLKNIEKLARALGLTVSDLLRGIDKDGQR